jgi:hypothetical protein
MNVTIRIPIITFRMIIMFILLIRVRQLRLALMEGVGNRVRRLAFQLIRETMQRRPDGPEEGRASCPRQRVRRE